MVNTYQPGNAIVLRCQVLDPSSTPPALVDPDTITIDILDPNGVLVINAQNMVRTSIGKYSFIYQSLTTDLVSPNPWMQSIVVTRSLRTNRKLSPSFILSKDPVA